MKGFVFLALLLGIAAADVDYDDYAYGMGGWTPSQPVPIPYPVANGQPADPSVAPLRPVMGVDQPSVVSVGNLEGGGDVDLPPPPEFKPELSTQAAGQCWKCEDKLTYDQDQTRLNDLLQRIADKQDQLDAHDDWLQSAKHSIQRVKQQIAITQSNHDQLVQDMARLKQQKARIDRETQRQDLIASMGLQQSGSDVPYDTSMSEDFGAEDLGLDSLSTDSSALNTNIPASDAGGATDDTGVKMKFRQIPSRKPRRTDAMKQSQQEVLDKLKAFEKADNQLASLQK